MDWEFTDWRGPVAAWRAACKEIARANASQHKLLKDTLPTLIACSGGADSAALAICLAAARVKEHVRLVYIDHGQRTASCIAEDASRVRSLSAMLGIDEPIIHSLQVGQGASESVLRSARYDALLHIAQTLKAPVIATGHHADDQTETILMRLARGTGFAGMRGITQTRRLDTGDRDPVWVTRPLLSLQRKQCEHICEAHGFQPADDPTNRDTRFTRNAFRTFVLPEIERIEPGASIRISHAAQSFSEANEIIERLAREAIDPNKSMWTRDELRAHEPLVLKTGIRNAFLRLTRYKHADATSSDTLERIARAIKDDSTETRIFQLRDSYEFVLDAHSLRVHRSEELRIE